MRAKGRADDRARGRMIRRPGGREGLRARGVVTIVCRDKDGHERWRQRVHNLVVNAGLDYLIDAGLNAATQITSWFISLITDNGTPAAGDTMGSHAGWTEDQGYSEGTRVAYAAEDDGVGALTNSAAPATFTITGSNRNIMGVFLTSVNTKGGTTGTLYSAVAFTGGDRAVVATDTLEVTYDQSVADDGA